jgi:hypothetical protein
MMPAMPNGFASWGPIRESRGRWAATVRDGGAQGLRPQRLCREHSLPAEGNALRAFTASESMASSGSASVSHAPADCRASSTFDGRSDETATNSETGACVAAPESAGLKPGWTTGPCSWIMWRT